MKRHHNRTLTQEGNNILDNSPAITYSNGHGTRT